MEQFTEQELIGIQIALTSKALEANAIHNDNSGKYSPEHKANAKRLDEYYTRLYRKAQELRLKEATRV